MRIIFGLTLHLTAITRPRSILRTSSSYSERFGSAGPGGGFSGGGFPGDGFTGASGTGRSLWLTVGEGLGCCRGGVISGAGGFMSVVCLSRWEESFRCSLLSSVEEWLLRFVPRLCEEKSNRKFLVKKKVV